MNIYILLWQKFKVAFNLRYSVYLLFAQNATNIQPCVVRGKFATHSYVQIITIIIINTKHYASFLVRQFSIYMYVCTAFTYHMFILWALMNNMRYCVPIWAMEMVLPHTHTGWHTEKQTIFDIENANMYIYNVYSHSTHWKCQMIVIMCYASGHMPWCQSTAQQSTEKINRSIQPDIVIHCPR